MSRGAPSSGVPVFYIQGLLFFALLFCVSLWGTQESRLLWVQVSRPSYTSIHSTRYLSLGLALAKRRPWSWNFQTHEQAHNQPPVPCRSSCLNSIFSSSPGMSSAKGVSCPKVAKSQQQPTGSAAVCFEKGIGRMRYPAPPTGRPERGYHGVHPDSRQPCSVAISGVLHTTPHPFLSSAVGSRTKEILIQPLPVGVLCSPHRLETVRHARNIYSGVLPKRGLYRGDGTGCLG